MHRFMSVWSVYVCVYRLYVYIDSRIQRNLSIHIARFSASESLRVYPNIYKNSPPFTSSKGVPQVGFAMRVSQRPTASFFLYSRSEQTYRY